jgi:hypothetical protein
MAAMLMVLGVAAAGCGWKPSAPSPPPPDNCADSDGPTEGTVRRAIAELPPVAGHSGWEETSGGHTRNCRLYWVKLHLSDATEGSPEQLLFFDHNTPLGSPTANPKPYTTVMSAGENTVTVQYQWRVGDEPLCCPTGIGTTRYAIGPDGKLTALDPVPDQQ